jgi:hypothetical protein
MPGSGKRAGDTTGRSAVDVKRGNGREPPALRNGLFAGDNHRVRNLFTSVFPFAITLVCGEPSYSDGLTATSPTRASPPTSSAEYLFSEAISLCVANAAVPSMVLKSADEDGWERGGPNATSWWRYKPLDGTARFLRVEAKEVVQARQFGRLVVRTCSVTGAVAEAARLDALASAYLGRTAQQRSGPVEDSPEGLGPRVGAASFWAYQDDPKSGKRFVPPTDPGVQAALAKGPVLELAVFEGEPPGVEFRSIQFANEPHSPMAAHGP